MALQVSAGRALSYRLWAQHLSGENRAQAERYAAFRGLALDACRVEVL